MLHYTKEDLGLLNSRYRANMINSCTGYKSCNLLATQSAHGTSNLAVFNSVVHIGSNPAMLGFVLRPLTVRRDTYNNFKETGHFTVNQVNAPMIKGAHATAAKYDEGVSEFSKSGFTEAYLDGFAAPYVKESHIKIGCSYKNEYKIAENGCLLIIGAIEHIYLEDGMVHQDGWVQLDATDTVSAVGVDAYALPKIVDRFSYPRPDEAPKSIL
ncbi:flavin reductase [Maribacter sp. 2307ULW6-5]|uniref:flavin reductase family protein n=1 Tax=Maribacter sp. 2307ULW6-5 TaxID=3386275 RepID=UPI0039BCF743